MDHYAKAAAVAAGLSGAPARVEAAAEGVLNQKCNTIEVVGGTLFKTVIYYTGTEDGKGEKLKAEIRDSEGKSPVNHTVATERFIYNWDNERVIVSVTPLNPEYRKPGGLKNYLDGLRQITIGSGQPFKCA